MMSSSSAIVLRNMWVDLPYSIAFLTDIGRDCLSGWPGKKKVIKVVETHVDIRVRMGVEELKV